MMAAAVPPIRPCDPVHADRPNRTPTVTYDRDPYGGDLIMLDLKFSAEQEMLRETVRGVCATTCPLSVVRELEDDPVGYSPELWKQLAHLDLIGLQLPEEYGGSGMTTLENVILYEEFGRSLAPSPHFVSSVLCGGALVQAGTDDQKTGVAAPAGHR